MKAQWKRVENVPGSRSPVPMASILAKNTTIWPQLQRATSPTSLDTSLGLPVAWAQGDRLSNLSRSSGSWARCVCMPAWSLGRRGALGGGRLANFSGGVRGSALWAWRGRWRSAWKCEPRHWGELGRAERRFCFLQPELCAAGVEMKRTAGARCCRCQAADTGLAGQARPGKMISEDTPPEDSGSEVQPGVQLGGTKPLVTPGT